MPVRLKSEEVGSVDDFDDDQLVELLGSEDYRLGADGKVYRFWREDSFDPVKYLALLSRVLSTDIREVMGRGVESFYRMVCIPKGSGGTRTLMVPQPPLLQIQRRINKFILNWLRPHPACHGFTSERSIFTNAAAHLGANHLFTIDIVDAFGSVTEEQVFAVFYGQKLGFNQIGWYVAKLLSNLCTVYIEGRLFRCLPQGAPTSPAVFNLVCIRMDRKLSEYCAKVGVTYTRYADNMFFSSARPLNEKERRIICKIVWGAGFLLNDKKTRLMRVSGHTNLVLPGVSLRGEGFSLTKRNQKRLRAAIYQARKRGESRVLNGLLSFAHQVYGSVLPRQLGVKTPSE